MTAASVITIHPRYNGPPTSGHGGYTAGLIAALFGGSDVEVTLRRPPPLGAPMEVAESVAGVQVMHDGEIIAEARRSVPALDLPPPVAFDVAEDASRGYPGFAHHPFPTCFTCGPDRTDGLRLFPGPVDGSTTAAAPWVPDASLAIDGSDVAPEFLWAALDCPGGWGTHDYSPGREAVLGRITAHLERPVVAGRRYVVTGWPVGIDGRKMYSGSAIFDEDGAPCAFASATWILFDG